MPGESWRKNFYTIFFAQLIVFLGFHISNGFMPLYVQKLGNFDSREAAFWAGIATGVSGIASFFMAPLWGVIADRWGRNPMLLRTTLGGAVVLALTGLAPNIYWLVALRFAYGAFAGNIAAAAALIAVTTPREKLSFVMGLLSVAHFVGGSALGPLVGGTLADAVGYENTFFITAGLLVVGGLVVLFFAREKFEPPQHIQGVGEQMSRIVKLAGSRKMLPLLMVEVALHASNNMISPTVPLIIGQLSPENAATKAGLTVGLIGLTASASAWLAGRLGESVSLRRLLVISCLLGAALQLPPIWATGVTQFVLFVAMTGLPKGGLLTSVTSLVGVSVSTAEQGVAYGIDQSARAIGSGLGPFIGGGLARWLGLRPIFGVSGGLLLVSGLLVSRLLPETTDKTGTSKKEP